MTTHKETEKTAQSNGNIYPLVFGIIVFVITILGAGITIYNSFHVPLANAISSETQARIKADDDIRATISEFLMQNEKDHSKISNQLTRLIALMDRAEKSNRLGNNRT